MLDSILIQSLLGTIIIYGLFQLKSKDASSYLSVLYKYRILIGLILSLTLLIISVQLIPHNYYDVIGVGRWASRSDITQAIRIAKKKYHPDKNLEDDKASSVNIFYEIQRIESVLNSESKRNIYNKYGDYRKDGIIDDRNIIMLSEDPNPMRSIPFIGSLLPFEKILVLRSIFPTILILTFLYSAMYYKNYDDILLDMLRGNLITNKRIIDLTQSLLIQIQTHGFGSAKSSSNTKGNVTNNGISLSTTPYIEVDSDLENDNVNVARQMQESLKSLTSTMNEDQKQQLQKILNIAISAKNREIKKQQSWGIFGSIFNSNILWIIVAVIAMQYIKGLFS
ncbi:DnaJ domain-containing protein [Cryptosporidium muris RN66]|uniref:DnaJ domain-containing protein n=1 Tax=Cryptosporidium muris (strain RN66) TaxID=441375 RepID=B6AI60_CRYMR|nr:DnaJ domain-containing protein [Cryptosporidium muris RN66]EEA07901.1 DnaJ domain-containing protein [Cryptosporidium muris RN66]|eukprot:XP_002142250.1 DnaJ domain-containing protein [Cryptosporidium muris RN66]